MTTYTNENTIEIIPMHHKNHSAYSVVAMSEDGAVLDVREFGETEYLLAVRAARQMRKKFGGEIIDQTVLGKWSR